MGAFSLLTRFIAFLFKIYLARSLGAEAVGLYQVGLSVYFMLAALTATGIPLILSRKIAAIDGEGDRAASSFISAGLIICLGISAVLIVFCFIFSSQIEGIFTDKRAMPLFLIMAPALISTSMYCVFRAFLLGKKQYTAYSVTELVEEIIRALLGVLLSCGLFAALKGAKGIAIAFTVSDFLCAAILAVMYFVRGGRLRKPQGFREISSASAPITLMRIFGSITASLIAILIPIKLVATGLTASEATAAYGRVAGMALPLIMAPTTFTGALAIVLVPEISGSKKDAKGLGEKLGGSLFFSVYTACLFCALYIPLGVEITTVLFDDAIAGEFVSRSALLIFPIGLNQVSSSILNSLSYEKNTFVHYLIGSVFLVLSLIFAPAFIGIYAVALGFGLCFTVTSVLNLRLLYKRVSFSVDVYKMLLALVAAAACALLAYFVKGILILYLPLFWVVAGACIAGGLCFVALTFALKLFDFRLITGFLSPKKLRLIGFYF